MKWFVVVFSVLSSNLTFAWDRNEGEIIGPLDRDMCLKVAEQIQHWHQPVYATCVHLDLDRRGIE